MSAGWSHRKRVLIETQFYTYLDVCVINSKDAVEPICLGKCLYDGQRRVITEIFDALEAGIHRVFILKSRQLGITTIIRALTTFLLGIQRGLKGALVFDTNSNRENSRTELETMIKDLPASIAFPKVKSTNREGLTLFNDSQILFKSAGVKKSKVSGTLGRSVGLSMAHLSEICSYDNKEGLISFEESLSDINPNRLYVYESTARGFNEWYNMWTQARKDTAHCKCIFIGFWAKETQRIDESDPDFELYGRTAPSEKELEKIKLVREQYGVDVTIEQLAWLRRKLDPTAVAEGDADPEFVGEAERVQEQCWDELDAFQNTGSVFFAAEKLTDLTNKWVTQKFQTYMFMTGEEFTDMRIYKAQNVKSIELKVWEEPDPEGIYVLAADPAFGENEHNDRSSIQVLRCYADGVDQVAEYAWPLITTRQFAWVIASLLAWYGQGRAEARYILELNGPGGAVFNEMRSLRHQIDNGYHKEADERGLKDFWRNVKTYLYTRQDSLGAGFNFHFKTNTNLKITLLNRLRDFVHNGTIHVRSMELINEMRTIAQEGDSICSPGNLKDDRVIAMAMAMHCWEERSRRDLIVKKRTRESEAARQRLTVTDQVYLFQKNMLSAFFNERKMDRVRAERAQQRNAWRYGRR